MAKQKIIRIILIGVFLYILLNSCMMFWNGYHNLDLSFNFLNLGYTQDKGINENYIKLEESYLTGLNGMRNGFMWLGFDLILAVYLGYLLK